MPSYYELLPLLGGEDNGECSDGFRDYNNSDDDGVGVMLIIQ